MSEFDQVAYSTAGLFQLVMLTGVCVIAFLARSRRVAVFGGLGILLGLVIPEPRIYVDYQTVEGAYLGSLNYKVHYLAFWAIVGFTIGTCLAVYLDHRKKMRAQSLTESTAAESADRPEFET